jgi:hypothetical protein
MKLLLKLILFIIVNPSSYFLIHQFRRLNQKKQLLEAALNVLDPTILQDIVITLHTGLTDKTFANLIAPYPEAKNM